MFKPVLLWSFVLLAITAPLGYYLAYGLQTEWSIRKGREAFQKGEFQEAVHYLTSALDKPSMFSLACWSSSNCSDNLRRMLAQSHLALGQDEDALRHYRKLHNARAYFVLGLDDIKLGKWDEGINHFKAAIQLEADCTICQEALEKAENAKAASASRDEARAVQAKALFGMLTPTKCLCSIAGITAITMGASTVSTAILNPQLVNLFRKAGATKRVAEEVLNQLERALSSQLREVLIVAVSDVCSPPSEVELIKSVLENDAIQQILNWAELVPFSGDARRATIAAIQAATLASLIYQYGHAFLTERKSGQEIAAAETGRAAYWIRLVEASKDPTLLDRNLQSLTAPTVTPNRGWVEKTLDTINPINWFPAWKWF